MSSKELKIVDLPFVTLSKNYLREISLALFALTSLLVWTDSWDIKQVASFMIWFAILYVYAVIGSYNSRTGLIPNSLLTRLLLPLTIAFVVMNALWGPVDLLSSSLGFLVFGVLSYSLFTFSNGRYIGGGVVKLLAISGLLLGFTGSLIAMALLILGIFITYLVSKEKIILVGWLIYLSVAISKIIESII